MGKVQQWQARRYQNHRSKRPAKREQPPSRMQATFEVFCVRAIICKSLQPREGSYTQRCTIQR